MHKERIDTFLTDLVLDSILIFNFSASIRKSLGLQAGDKLKLEVLKGEIKLKPLVTVKAQDLRA